MKRRTNLMIRLTFKKQTQGLEIENFLHNMINLKKMNYIRIIRNHRKITQFNWAAMNLIDKNN
jgi:hypothetical protein